MDIGAPELRELRRSGDFRGESQLEFLRVAAGSERSYPLLAVAFAGAQASA
jgi:hypothetical protein